MIPVCFSPVAGIQWVETIGGINKIIIISLFVSVPLPGFSGLRRAISPAASRKLWSFSPVAGIQWVETIPSVGRPNFASSFSPVAGIQWVETLNQGIDRFT